MIALVEWFKSTKKDRERVKAGGIEVHTSESGRRHVKAEDVLRSDSAREHFKAMSELTGHTNNGKGNGKA